MNNKRTMLDFEPVRSIMHIDCADEEYRIKIERWLYKHHISDSISQFGPYVTKYAFYSALPVPEGGDKYGAVRMQMTEHYWIANPNNVGLFTHNKAFDEFIPPENLVWQGIIPPEAAAQMMNIEGDASRSNDADLFALMRPLVFAFIPMWWEEDLKGKGRTIEDGPNYRWQIVVHYPEEAGESGDQWFMNQFLPAFVGCEETTRILTSRTIKKANNGYFDRVAEIWFDGPNEWKSAIEKVSQIIEKPEWASTETFPYFKPQYEISSIFLSDIARTDNYQYHGYVTMR